MNIRPEEKNWRSPAFSQWFGEEALSGETALCVQPANIDMIPDNVFIRGGEYITLDCEWVADFPVPLAFAMRRVLVSVLHAHPELETLIGRETLMERDGIRPADEAVYDAWSAHFEAEDAGNRGLSRFSKGVRAVTLDQRKMDWQEARIKDLEGELKTFTDSFTCKAVRKLRRELLPGNRRKTGEQDP